MTDTTAREALYAALMADGITGRGHSPDRSEKASALIDAFRDQVLTEAADRVAAYTGNPIDANAQMLRRLAARTTQES